LLFIEQYLLNKYDKYQFIILFRIIKKNIFAKKLGIT